MVNVELRVDENEILHISVDLKKVAGFTRSHNVLVASTHGNIPLPGPDCSLRPEKLNLSVWRHRTPFEKAHNRINLSGWEEEEKK